MLLNKAQTFLLLRKNQIILQSSLHFENAPANSLKHVLSPEKSKGLVKTLKINHVPAGLGINFGL